MLRTLLSRPRTLLGAAALVLGLASTGYSASCVLNSIYLPNWTSGTTVDPYGPFVLLQAIVQEGGSGPSAIGGAAAFSNSNAILKFDALGRRHHYATLSSDWSWVQPFPASCAGRMVYWAQ